MRQIMLLAVLIFAHILPAHAERNIIEEMYVAGIEAAQKGDYITAYWKFLTAAKEGNTEAQFQVGRMYYVGISEGGQNYSEAARWLLIASKAGHLQAQTMLGNMYARGYGVPKDDTKSLDWTSRAAESGDPVAQVAMAARYADGIGVPKDYVQTHMWLRLAWERLPASQNHIISTAIRIMKGTIKKMSDAEKAEAKMLADNWKPK